MAEWLHTNSSSENSAAARKTYQMNDGDRMRKRKRVEGSGISGLLSTFTAPKLKSSGDVLEAAASRSSPSQSTALQLISKNYSESSSNKPAETEELFPFYNKPEEKKPEVRLISRSQPSPREALHSAPKQTTPKQTPPTKTHIPFLKTPEDEEPMKPQRSRFKDERSESREVPTETRRSSNPINRPIDGAPTRRPKEEPSQKPPQIGSTADNPMTLDSSEDEADNNNSDVHQWCISAAHIGSLTKLDVSILEINQEHFEFNVTSDVLLAEVKVCVPWNEIVKMESHFSSDLHALVIHVEELWAVSLISQLKNALSRQIPLELDPKSGTKYKRVISLEFVKEPPPQHITMMGYYLDKHHSVKMNRIEYCSAAHVKDLLPPVDHFDSHMDTDVIEQDTRTLLVYPPPPAQASITLTYADLECLKPEEFLNDSILDFYLKYIHHELMSPVLRDKTHLFNSFFYKALTQPIKKETKNDPASKRLSNSERMHQQVRKWSKSIDLFSKDYIIVPINEHQHWYLAIICYPWLEAPHYEDNKTWTPANKRSERGDQDDTVDEKDIDGVLSKNKEHSTVPPISCRPCILMFDSLVANGRNKVVNNIRNYLAVEWKTKPDRGPRNFNKQNFPGIFVEGPLQENFCDCGVFLLQFVEKFFESPITDYRFPVERKDWFSQQDITKKRESLRKLIVRLGPNRQFTDATSKR
ncbi:hypothetical protein ACHWQZ_G006266 [Mnemiopsis leidyi]